MLQYLTLDQLGARDAQVRSLVGQHYNNKYQEFPSFYDRLMKIIESLTVRVTLLPTIFFIQAFNCAKGIESIVQNAFGPTQCFPDRR